MKAGKAFEVFESMGVKYIATRNNFDMLDVVDENFNYYGGWQSVKAFLAHGQAVPVGLRRLVTHEV